MVSKMPSSDLSKVVSSFQCVCIFFFPHAVAQYCKDSEKDRSFRYQGGKAASLWHENSVREVVGKVGSRSCFKHLGFLH